MSDYAAEDEVLCQVCSEKDLASVAKQLIGWESVYMYLDVTEPEIATIKANHLGDYETQKIQILKTWKMKRGEFQGHFKALSEVFVRLRDQRMVDVIKRVAVEAYKETSENSVIERLEEFKAVSYEKLIEVARQVGLFTNTHLETFEDAANDVKKIEIILNALMNLLKPQLVHFMRSLATQGEPAVPMLMSPPPYTDIKNVEKAFRNTVKNIRNYLERCDVQELVINFNMVVDKEKFPYFTNRVKEKLYRCKTISDLFARISPFINWKKREVLRELVEVSECQEAVAELNQFEAQLDYNQLIVNFPLPAPSNSICPDPESDAMIVSIKSNQDLKKTSLRGVYHLEDTIAQTGGVSKKDLDLQAKNSGSSILYWLMPKNMVKSFEANIRNNLDYLYAQGIVEISLDPNIVITTGHKLRVRSLSYLTKLPPPQDTRRPQRAEELEELPSPGTQLPERAEEIVELAHQLKIDMRKREKEIMELDKEVKEMDDKVKILEKDKEEKEQECIKLQEQLVETAQENEELKQIIEVSVQPSKIDTTPAPAVIQEITRGIHPVQHVNLSFGIRGHTAVRCGGKIYIGGGVVSKNSGATPNIIQVVDLTTQRVSQLPPCVVKYFALVSIDNQVVTVGGKTISDDQVTNKLYCWKEATQQWEESLPPMLTPRHFNTSVVWNNFLIVCGGRIDNEDSITDCVEVLNLQSKQWHCASPLPLKESGKHAVIIDSKLYLLGGYLGNAVHYCQLQKLVASTVTVRQAQPLEQEDLMVWRRLEDTPSNDCAAVLLAGSLVIIGGYSYETNQISSRILRYSDTNDEWRYIGDMLFGRTACVATSLDYNSVFVTGGSMLHGQQPEWFSASTEIVSS